MKTIVAINTVPYGSTAGIMVGIASVANENEYCFHLYTGYSYHPMKTPKTVVLNRIGGLYSRLSHIVLSRITGKDALFSKRATKILIKKLEKIQPDVIHLHNLHDWFIDIRQLFAFIKRTNVKTIWTFHDCWPFTGYCTHFQIARCNKWKTECQECQIRNIYPKCKIDRSNWMFNLKKELFLGVKDLTIVTPSNWLASLVKESFLKDYPVKVINNGIDLSVFKPTKNDFRQEHNLDGKFVILGVSLMWDYRKGLDVFIDLANLLDERFQIVLVGTDDKIDKSLPKNIISVHRTQNQQELADIYSSSDVFLNPSREENFPTVNIESLACGTPIISFDTGGSPEIFDEKCGIKVKKDDFNGIVKAINELFEKNVDSNKCIERSKKFDRDKLFKEYLELYKEL